MRKLALLFAGIVLFGGELRYGLHIEHAFGLGRHWLISAEYQKLNDTLDIFNIKSQEISSAVQNYASIGNLDGGRIQILKGWGNILAGGSAAYEAIDFGEGKLYNSHMDALVRYSIQNDLSGHAIAIDGGIEYNRADDISYTNPRNIESLAKKFLDIQDIRIQDNIVAVLKNDGTTDILTLAQPPAIKLENMQDTTFFVRFLAEKRLSSKLYLSSFATLRYTLITTTVTAELIPQDANTANLLADYDLSRTLDREEKSITVGFNVTYDRYFLWEFSYRYMHFFRSSDLDYVNYNHIIDFDILKPITRNSYIFVGGKFMYRQFNGVIPYLYNRYTQTTFDHKYGYAKIGIGILF